MSALQNNLHAIKERIHQAAVACGRSAQDIKLLAVSKTFPAEDVRDAYDLGQTCFGENYVQEGVAKVLELKICAPALSGTLSVRFKAINRKMSQKTLTGFIASIESKLRNA